MNHKITILVVDDDPDVRYATIRVIRSAGYRVLEAATGRDCIWMAKEYRPGMILLDVVLPDIMGTEVCRRIKAAPFFDGMFVILTSGVKTASRHQTAGLDTGSAGNFISTGRKPICAPFFCPFHNRYLPGNDRFDPVISLPFF